uniref:Cytochrome c oxidase subunit 7B, mitochondrial n=1 Tax=Pelusios castaneus TaxID=367368 RepID=A0A8C8RE48_9SAUR
MLFPLAQSALRLSARSIQRIAARQSHYKYEPDFHDKYGNLVLAGGSLFCVGVWAYVVTQAGVEWNLSPVGRVTPKEWREK